MSEKTVLLVEDEFISARMIVAVLKTLGFSKVIHVSKGEAAIIYALENTVDVILMDIRLAGKIDGIEAASEILKVKKVPIILITGYDVEQIKERVEVIKPLAILTKPIKPEIIAEKLTEAFS